MNITELKDAFSVNRCQFISLNYTGKESLETARFTVLLGASYLEACRKDIIELEIRLGNTRGIERAVINQMIASLKESLLAKKEGREHALYTKAGIYTPVSLPNGELVKGLKINLNDGTAEIQGLVHSKVIIAPGIERKPVKHRSEETALKASLRRELRIGKLRTFAVDPGHIHTCKVSGDVLEFW